MTPSQAPFSYRSSLKACPSHTAPAMFIEKMYPFWRSKLGSSVTPNTSEPYGGKSCSSPEIFSFSGSAWYILPET